MIDKRRWVTWGSGTRKPTRANTFERYPISEREFMRSPAFHRYIGIDYSGAETPDSSLKGLRVYEGDRESVPVEVYPSLWSKSYPREGRTPDQHDAYVAATWLRQVDTDGSLEKFLKPSMLPGEYHVARVEGWILGVL